MSERDKRQDSTNDNRVQQLGFHKPERKKFEILYQPWTPYFRPGSWLQFIWRF